jgi:hypothetical protein
MKGYWQENYRIYLSIILSLIIVLFIIPIFTTPRRLINLLSKIKFPEINFGKIFTLNFPETKKDEDQSLKKYNENIKFIKMTVEPTQILSPTIYNDSQLFITPLPSFQPKQDITFSQPTVYIKPTKTPKPTKAPDVFPIDLSLARPGKTTDEVFEIASQKTCVPKEVLKAIAYIESGGFFDVVSPKYFLLYNSYNWWNSEFLTEEKRICGGYGYDLNTGLVPDDSKFAGYKCKDGYNSGLNVMGVMSVSSYEQSKYGKKVAQLLGVDKADRRVILDALMIVGLIIKDNVKPSSCSNWSGHDIVKAACGYYGSCGIADGTYYCATFCRNYKKFGGKGSCDASSFGDNCWQ